MYLRIEADFLRSYGAYVDRTVHVTDGCVAAAGAHELYLNAKARTLAPIRVTGNFGSEVLRRMSTMKPLGLSQWLLRPDLAREVARVSRESGLLTNHPVTRAAFCEVPWSLYGTLAAARSLLTVRTPYMDDDLVSLAFRAPECIQSSLDPWLRIVQRANPLMTAIPTDRGVLLGDRGLRRLRKRLVSEVSFKLDYWRTSGLPRRAARLAPLLGSMFGTDRLPSHRYLEYRRWYRDELSAYARAVLSDPQTLRLNYWNQSAPETAIADHIAGRGTYVKEISAVLTLEAIQRLLCAHTPAGPELRRHRIEHVDC